MPRPSATRHIADHLLRWLQSWRTPPLDSSTHHWGWATSLHSKWFHWLKANERIDFKVAVFVDANVNTGLYHLTSLMSYVVQRTCKVEVVFVMGRYHIGGHSSDLPLHSWWSVLHGCRPLPLEQLTAACHLCFFAASLQESSLTHLCPMFPKRIITKIAEFNKLVWTLMG